MEKINTTTLNDNISTTASCKQSPFLQHKLCTLHAHKHDIAIDWFERFYVGDFFLSTAVAGPLFSIPKRISLEHPNTFPAAEQRLTYRTLSRLG